MECNYLPVPLKIAYVPQGCPVFGRRPFPYEIQVNIVWVSCQGWLNSCFSKCPKRTDTMDYS
jgi:hypothetical protein